MASNWGDWTGKRVVVEAEERDLDSHRFTADKRGRLDGVDQFGVWLKQDALPAPGSAANGWEACIVFYPWGKVQCVNFPREQPTLAELRKMSEDLAREEQQAWQELEDKLGDLPY